MESTNLGLALCVLLLGVVLIDAKSVKTTTDSSTTEDYDISTTTESDTPALVIVEYVKPRLDLYIEVYNVSDGNSANSAETSSSGKDLTDGSTTMKPNVNKHEDDSR